MDEETSTVGSEPKFAPCNVIVAPPQLGAFPGDTHVTTGALYRKRPVNATEASTFTLRSNCDDMVRPTVFRPAPGGGVHVMVPSSTNLVSRHHLAPIRAAQVEPDPTGLKLHPLRVTRRSVLSLGPFIGAIAVRIGGSYE